MKLHLNKELFKDFIDTLNTRTGIAIDILEKDYYVCLILDDLAKKQNQIDYENILDAGFKNVELIPIYEREYYKTKEDLLALLLKTPILNDFSEGHENNNLKEDNIDMQILNRYIENNTTNRGILLRRRYYGIIANK